MRPVAPPLLAHEHQRVRLLARELVLRQLLGGGLELCTWCATPSPRLIEEFGKYDIALVPGYVGRAVA